MASVQEIEASVALQVKTFRDSLVAVLDDYKSKLTTAVNTTANTVANTVITTHLRGRSAFEGVPKYTGAISVSVTLLSGEYWVWVEGTYHLSNLCRFIGPSLRIYG